MGGSFAGVVPGFRRMLRFSVNPGEPLVVEGEVTKTVDRGFWVKVVLVLILGVGSGLVLFVAAGLVLLSGFRLLSVFVVSGDGVTGLDRSCAKSTPDGSDVVGGLELNMGVPSNDTPPGVPSPVPSKFTGNPVAVANVAASSPIVDLLDEGCKNGLLIIPSISILLNLSALLNAAFSSSHSSPFPLPSSPSTPSWGIILARATYGGGGASPSSASVASKSTHSSSISFFFLSTANMTPSGESGRGVRTPSGGGGSSTWLISMRRFPPHGAGRFGFGVSEALEVRGEVMVLMMGLLQGEVRAVMRFGESWNVVAETAEVGEAVGEVGEAGEVVGAVVTMGSGWGASWLGGGDWNGGDCGVGGADDAVVATAGGLVVVLVVIVTVKLEVGDAGAVAVVGGPADGSVGAVDAAADSACGGGVDGLLECADIGNGGRGVDGGGEVGCC